MKIIMVVLLLGSVLFADYSCTSAGADIEQYSREYDDALDEYENALTQDDKESAYDDIQTAKSNLDSAVNSALLNCENSSSRILGQLLNENKALKKENQQLQQQINDLLVQLEIAKIKLIYPKFDVAKIIPYVRKQPQLNNPDGWKRIWVKYFVKAN